MQRLRMVLELMILSLGTDIVGAISPHQLQIFDDQVSHLVNCKGLTGGVISIVSDKKVVYTRGFGYKDLNMTKPVTNTTRFSIGSLTKAFTSTVLAKVLSQNSNYNWDTPLVDVLGKSFYLSNELIRNNVNLRDLLAHKVGLAADDIPAVVGFPEGTSREEMIRMIGHLEPVAPFRTQFIYNNYLYALAGYVAEKISGKSWESLVREIIMDPLEMRDSGFVDQLVDFRQFSSAFIYVNGKVEQIDDHYFYSVAPAGPAGSIYSTPVDMAKWMIFNLNVGSATNGTRLIQKEYFSEIHKEQMQIQNGYKYRPSHPVAYGASAYDFGWFSSIYRGYKAISHGGQLSNHVSVVQLFPDLGSGVFVSLSGSRENGMSSPHRIISFLASDLLLGEKQWLNQSTACSFPSRHKPLPIVYANSTKADWNWNISNSADKYKGEFINSAFGKITVQYKNGNLRLFYGRFGKMKLLPITNESFVGMFTDILSFLTYSDNSYVRPLSVKFDFFGEDVSGLYFQTDLYRPSRLFTRIDLDHRQSNI